MRDDNLDGTTVAYWLFAPFFAGTLLAAILNGCTIAVKPDVPTPNVNVSIPCLAIVLPGEGEAVECADAGADSVAD